jgi:hypothetical protein
VKNLNGLSPAKGMTKREVVALSCLEALIASSLNPSHESEREYFTALIRDSIRIADEFLKELDEP